MSAIMPGVLKIKVLVIGDMNVGKTSLAYKYQHGAELNDSEATISFNITHNKLKIDNETVVAQIWDTAGQEKFHSLSSQYYRNANAVIIVYDITKKQTFNSLEYWIRECEKNGIDINVPKIIIGNKCDCYNYRQVILNEGQTFASKHDIPFYETFKGDEAVKHIFEALLRKVVLTKNYKRDNNEDSFRPGENEQENEEQPRSYCFINNLYLNLNFNFPSWMPWK